LAETGFSGLYKRFLTAFSNIRQVDLIHAWGEVMVPAMIAPEAYPER